MMHGWVYNTRMSGSGQNQSETSFNSPPWRCRSSSFVSKTCIDFSSFLCSSTLTWLCLCQASPQPCCSWGSAVLCGRSAKLCPWRPRHGSQTPASYTHTHSYRTSVELSHRWVWRNTFTLITLNMIWHTTHDKCVLFCFVFNRTSCSVGLTVRSRAWSWTQRQTRPLIVHLR